MDSNALVFSSRLLMFVAPLYLIYLLIRIPIEYLLFFYGAAFFAVNWTRCQYHRGGARLIYAFEPWWMRWVCIPVACLLPVIFVYFALIERRPPSYWFVPLFLEVLCLMTYWTNGVYVYDHGVQVQGCFIPWSELVRFHLRDDGVFWIERKRSRWTMVFVFRDSVSPRDLPLLESEVLTRGFNRLRSVEEAS
ncbi:MAG: hypothetical protein GC154_03610 [bacterium]|nr:hypothetical protein [bacterium]